MKNIYIDGLFYGGSGIGRYYESLVREISDSGIKVYTCVPRFKESAFCNDFTSCPNIEPIFVDYEKFSVAGFMKHGKILNQIAKSVDLLFFPHINLPWRIPRRSVVAIHDIRPLTQYWDRSFLAKAAFKYFLRRSILQTSSIVAVSSYTREQLLRLNYKINEISVIHEFPDLIFQNAPASSERILLFEYFLYIGNRKKHKNLETLLCAFHSIKHLTNNKLVIVGGKENSIDYVDELISKLNLNEYIFQFPHATDTEIINYLDFATLMILPSFYEGFGLPPLEAMARGCPVAVSDIPPLREVCADAAIYFDPHSADDLAACLMRTSNDTEFRNVLIQKGHDRLKHFNKSDIIAQHIELFERIAKRTQ